MIDDDNKKPNGQIPQIFLTGMALEQQVTLVTTLLTEEGRS